MEPFDDAFTQMQQACGVHLLKCNSRRIRIPVGMVFNGCFALFRHAFHEMTKFRVMKTLRFLSRLTAAVFLLLAGFLPAGEKPDHLFILSGQSNMVHPDPAADFLPEAQARCLVPERGGAKT